MRRGKLCTRQLKATHDSPQCEARESPRHWPCAWPGHLLRHICCGWAKCTSRIWLHDTSLRDQRASRDHKSQCRAQDSTSSYKFNVLPVCFHVCIFLIFLYFNANSCNTLTAARLRKRQEHQEKLAGAPPLSVANKRRTRQESGRKDWKNTCSIDILVDPGGPLWHSSIDICNLNNIWHWETDREHSWHLGGFEKPRSFQVERMRLCTNACWRPFGGATLLDLITCNYFFVIHRYYFGLHFFACSTK